MRLLRMLAVVSVATLVGEADPVAQSTFAQLGQQLRPNDRVRITVEGGRVEGKLVQLTGDELVMTIEGQRSTFRCPQIERIEKRGDPVWTGAVIGAAISALPAWNGCQNKGPNRPCVALAMGTYAAIGGLLDRAHLKTRTVYRASPGSCRS